MVYSAAFFILNLLYMSMGFIVLYKNRINKENRLFFTMMILFSVWASTNALLFLITDPEIASVVRKNMVISWGVVYSVLLHFVLVVTKVDEKFKSKTKKWICLSLIYIPALLNLIIYLFNFYGPNELILTNVGWIAANTIDRGFLWDNYFYFYYITALTTSLFVLVRWLKSTTIPVEKQQAKILLAGFLFAFALASLVEIILPLNGYILPFGTTLFVIFLPLFLISVAMVKYGFLSFGAENIGIELMSISNEGIILCNTKGSINEVNTKALDVLEYNEQLELTHVEMLNIDIKKLGNEKSIQLNLKTKPGKNIMVLFSSKSMYNSIKQEYGYLIMFLVIQELHDAQLQLEAYSEKLEHLVDERTKELKTSNINLEKEVETRIQSEERITFIANHDHLTEIYNRRFYNTQLPKYDHEKYYPLTLVVADINGLKLINDAFGHSNGDLLLQAAAKIIERNCVESGFVARIGGDEFLMLLPNTTSEETEVIVNNIHVEASKVVIQSITLSISLGHMTKTNKFTDIDSVYRTAEDLMYREKLLVIPSMRSGAIETILKALYEKDVRSEVHSRMVSTISERLATKCGLTHQEVSTVRTAALLHDIGKIIIPITILQKSGSLTEDEYNVIKSHTEIGFRILNSTGEMREISTIVLNHHEKWDGSGYPRGVKGNNIPYMSRIISVTDAYDAMTSERTYKSQLSPEDALIEIKKHSGIQFDQGIVKVFEEHFEEITQK